ncbi:MAG: urease accessory protein UreD [Sarcina ventriculi]|uniref:Urease accessory protein UreD n=1 Tax=Sarcina ventriculi TaxID=1267 RepID=A0ABP2ARC7_SARVE|nr:urease accessory protein UreD [Sarcina ventriculi]MDO4402393.1 urease accessory protein UreD [Clostridiaceae bacterium]MBU5322338.1 urease accessory protein UreD [Sarcina ventriculi]MCI5636291.1 urease accessory protein UreD [Sarcina ventriculi]MDD7373607.1 urease accessory protein UreD [Sarcina ventriculi]MDY7061881.1 urease accessory protein UreD [Sarcina ventriculi]
MSNLNDNKCAGLIDLVLEKQGDVVVSPRKYFNGVFKLSPKMELDVERIPAYFLMQLGGGIVEGEKYNINVELKENVRAIVTTQAASKVYKCENSYESFQETTLKLEENSILEYITDPVILYKDAVYRQENNIYMTKSSTLIYTDGITSGWSPDKKRFQYEKAKLKTNIYMDGVPVLLDNMLINPREDDIDGLGFMEGYKNFATLIILDDRIDKNIIEHLREEILKLNLDINFGITGLEVNGFVLRVIGNLTQDLEEVVGLCHNYIRRKILNSQNLTIRKL